MEVVVTPVTAQEEAGFRRLMRAHHYLGDVPKIGETLWYVARWRDHWVALLGFSAAALKCGARDRWIGWDFRIQYDRLHLVTNNSRFLLLPAWRRKNLGSRVLALAERRLAADWPRRFGHRVVLLETFVDRTRFRGTVYRAANWTAVGTSRGFQRARGGYAAVRVEPKLVFLKPLVADCRPCLTAPVLAPGDHHGEPRRMIPASQMRDLPEFFRDIDDPRGAQGRRYSLSCILALAAGATLCGMAGYKAIGEWARDLSQAARRRFGCRWHDGAFQVPCINTIRQVLMTVDPEQLDRALVRWNALYADDESAIALDGKTLCNAVNDDGWQTHVLGAVSHGNKTAYAQKKSS